MLNSKRSLGSNTNKAKKNKTNNSTVAEAEGGARARASRILPSMNYLFQAYPNGLHKAYIDGFNIERERINSKKRPMTDERVAAIARSRVSQYGYLPSPEYLNKTYTRDQRRIYYQSFNEHLASSYKDTSSSINPEISSKSESTTEDILQAIFSDTSNIISPTQLFSFHFSNTQDNLNETDLIESVPEKDRFLSQCQLRK